MAAACHENFQFALETYPSLKRLVLATKFGGEERGIGTFLPDNLLATDL